MSNLPVVPEDAVMPPDWAEMKPHQFKLSLAPLDELGFPYDRRSMVTTVPHDHRDYRKFAEDIARQVQNTVLLMLGLELEEKNG